MLARMVVLADKYGISELEKVKLTRLDYFCGAQDFRLVMDLFHAKCLADDAEVKATMAQLAGAHFGQLKYDQRFKTWLEADTKLDLADLLNVQEIRKKARDDLFVAKTKLEELDEKLLEAQDEVAEQLARWAEIESPRKRCKTIVQHA